MHKLAVGFGAALLLAGCGGHPGPQVSPADQASARARCDSYAAQAIQAADLAEATTLAAQASECYSNLRTRR